MQIHFSEALQFSDTKKDRLSTLIAKRVMLLIGERKSAQINNIYFSEDIPYTETTFSNSSVLSNGVITKWFNGKIDIHCHSSLLIKLLHQGTGYLLFDSVIIAASNNILLN